VTTEITGRRVYPNEKGELWLAPGDYGKAANGEWLARPPTDPSQHLSGSLKNHDVVEHEDGTITASPSILITGHEDDCKVEWHGYLVRGKWTSC
jgi:hypothetical protein